MTICIGALCADTNGRESQAVVVCSDRMVTMGGLTEYEHDVSKIAPIAGKVVALTAGDALAGSRVCRALSAAAPADAVVNHVAEAAGREYAMLRQHILDRDIFGPRGLSLGQFYQGNLQNQLLPQVVGQVDMQVMQYDLALDMLVAGVDDIGAHVCSIHNPGGGYLDWGTIGFNAIGSGSLHAQQSMIGFGHTAARGLHETVFRTYVSKRRAEVAPGVGRDTDLGIVDRSGIHFISAKVLDQLRQLYDEFQQPASDELMKRVRQLPMTEKEAGT